jgi:hypothetical protein
VKTYLLHYLKDIGLIEAVPDAPPAKGQVLSRGVCPLHDDADNRYAFLLYADGFVCTTHRCHREREFGHNIEGLIRHLAFRLTSRVLAWRDVWTFARQNADQFRALVADKVRPGRPGGTARPAVEWSRADLTACLEVPSAYYLDRGYRPETLRHFGVGTCVRPLPDGRRLLGWSVIPVLDRRDLPPLGYTARNPRWFRGATTPKWFHAVAKSEALFNRVNAQGSSTLIICEGPGCVMRFHEAGYPGAVATLGASFSEQQFFAFLSLLHRDVKVYIAGDRDDAGQAFAEAMRREIGGVCDPVVIYPPEGKKDFGDMTTEEVRQWMASAA